MTAFTLNGNHGRFQVAWEPGQAFGSRRRDQYTIRNPIAALPHAIDARFARDRHARLQGRMVSVLDPRRLVVLDANAMSLAVQDIFAEPCCPDDLQALMVHVTTACARDESQTPNFLRGPVRLIP